MRRFALLLTTLTACSVLNAPADVQQPAVNGGSGGTGGSGPGGTGGTGGAPPVCGNGAIESGEACDDGNQMDGDACSAACEVAAFVVAPGSTHDGDEVPAVGLSGADLSRFLVAWRHHDNAGVRSIQAACVDPGGAVGAAFSVTSVDPGPPRVATITGDASPDRGKSLVAYHGNSCAGGACTLRFRGVGPGCTPLGAVDKAIGGAVLPDEPPAVAASPAAKSFLVAWDNPAAGQAQTRVQAITADAAASGTPVDVGPMHVIGRPGAWASKGGFWVATDSADGLLSLQEIAPNASLVGAAFAVGTAPTCTRADGAYLGPNDELLAVFLEGDGVHRRRFSGPAAPAEAVTAVSPQAAGEDDPRVAFFGGRTVVVWTDVSKGQNCDVRARVFDASGVPLGLDFQVNPTEDPNGVPPPRCQRSPAVAVNANGDAMIVWDDFNILGNPSGPPVHRISAKLYPGLMVRPVGELL